MNLAVRILNVALALLVCFGLAFATLEIGLRALGLGPPPVNTEFDSSLGWRGRPGSEIRRETAEFDVTLELDSMGLRDDFQSPGDLTKARGTFRILFLGDSFVNGFTVSRSDLFVDLLEAAYIAEERRIEIVNAGVPGYSTDQQLVWLETHGPAFQPDLVVAFPYENDIWWNASGEYMGEAKPLFDDSGSLDQEPLPKPEARSWVGGTAVGRIPRLFRTLPTVAVAGQNVPVEMTSRLGLPPPATLAAEARTKLLIKRMAAVSREIGAKKFAISPIPSKAQMALGASGKDPATASDDGATDPHRPYRLFEEAAREADVPIVSTLKSLQESAQTGVELYFKRDFHLNPRGNAVLARALYDGLDTWALVPPRMGEANTAAPNPGRDLSGGTWPKWPLLYLALVIGLGTLFSRTCPDEEPQRAYLQVAALLGVIFAAVLLGSGLIMALPPIASRLTVAGLLIGLFSFIAHKLGDRVGTILELLRSFALRGHWYLLPLLSVLLGVGSLLVVAASSPLVAPLIYTLF